MSLSPFARLILVPLEERATPATAVYSALTQTLTVTAAQGDQIEVAPIPNDPVGYLLVTETQSSATVFTSDTAHQSVRNLVVRFGAVQSGGFTLDADARIGGNLTIGGATSSQTIDVLGTVGGNLAYVSNLLPAFEDLNFAGTAVVGGNVNIGLGGGQNTLRLKGGLIHGNLMVTGGGDDTIEMTADGNLTIDGSVNFNLGGGTNNVTGEGLSPQINVGGNFTYTGGTGNDTFNLDGSGTALHVKGDVKFTLGTKKVFDSNTVELEALTAGRSITFNSGIGTDSVEASGQLAAGTNVTVSLGDGSNSFDSNLLGMGVNSIGGSFTYNGGINGDVVNLDGTTIGKNMIVTLGESGGAGQVLFVGLKSPAGVTVYGNAKITGGSGSDGVLLRRLYVGGSLSLTTFAGNDTVTIDDTNIAGTSMVDLGQGDDLLQMELQTSDSGGLLAKPTTFGGTVTIKGGDGNDTVNLSADDPSTGTTIIFGGKISLQGGKGTDTLQNSADNIFKVTGNFDDFDTVAGPVLV